MSETEKCCETKECCPQECCSCCDISELRKVASEILATIADAIQVK